MHTPTKCTLAVLTLLTVAGCGSANDRMRPVLVAGEQSYRAKQYDSTVERLSSFLNAVQVGPEAARARYVRGMALAMLGRRPAAYSDLERAARQSADADIAWRANAVLGVMRFEDENWVAAAAALTAATSHMPQQAPLDALLYRLGLCYERTGRWAAAPATYRRILSEQPNGAYSGLANRRLQLNADHFAVQCGVFSQPPTADRLAADLQQKGLPAYVQREVRNGQTCRVVLVGRYATYPEAISGLARVRGYVSDAVLWP